MSPAKQEFTAYEKATILREHLVEGVPVCDICKKYGVSPSTVYEWRSKLFDEAHLTFGADSIEAEEEEPFEVIDHGGPYTDWADVPSPLPPGFDVARLPPLIKFPPDVEAKLLKKTVPYDPDSEEWRNAKVRWSDPAHQNCSIKIVLDPPYFKPLEPELKRSGAT